LPSIIIEHANVQVFNHVWNLVSNQYFGELLKNGVIFIDFR